MIGALADVVSWLVDVAPLGEGSLRAWGPQPSVATAQWFEINACASSYS